MQWRASRPVHRCMNVCLSVCAISHVSLKDVCNQGLTYIPSNSSLCKVVISVNSKTLLLWLIFYPMPGHLALWPYLWLKACSDLPNQGSRKCFDIYFSQTETHKEPYRNQLIKDAECQRGVIGNRKLLMS